MRHVLILLGGKPPFPTAVPDVDLVIAADSGLHLADYYQRIPDVVIGDFDSVVPERLELAAASGAQIVAHPTDKDATDFALALALAAERAATEITIAGGIGGRLDHLLANAAAMTSPELRHITVRARFGTALLTAIHDAVELIGAPGSYLSLLPVGGPAHGVRTTGLRWNLRSESLGSGTTRGVSNEFVASPAQVELEQGTLLAIQPDGTNAIDS
ncbi:MAG: thiamine diphosphokinase [Acidimicrobiia bacterium]